MKCFLSIDTDYWTSPNKAYIALNSLFGYLQNHPTPTIAVMNHQQLLGYVNDSKSDLLINVDTHADIAAEDQFLTELNCGTWLSFVKWRKQADYLWVRSGYIWQGNCNGVAGERWNRGHGWNSAKTKKMPENLDLVDLVKDYELTGVGLVLSPDYIVDGELEEVFRYVISRYNLLYRKGRRNENYARKVKPKGF